MTIARAFTICSACSWIVFGGCSKQSCVSPTHIRVTAYPSTSPVAGAESMRWTDVPASAGEHESTLYSGRVDWNSQRIVVDGHTIKPISTRFVACDASIVNGVLVCAIVESIIPRYILSGGEDAKLHVIESGDHAFIHNCFSIKGLKRGGFDQDTPTFIRVGDNGVIYGGHEIYAFALVQEYNEYICTTIPDNFINRLSVLVSDDKIVFLLDASRYHQERTRWTAVWKRHCSRSDKQ